MATAVIGQAVLGGAVGQFFGEVKENAKAFGNSAIDFEYELLQLQATLKSLEPFFVEIKRPGSDQILSKVLAMQLEDILKQIEQVVRECKDNNFWFWEKAEYAEELKDLDKKLRGFFQLNAQAKVLVDNEAMLKKQKELGGRFDEMLEKQNELKGRFDEMLEKQNELGRRFEEMKLLFSSTMESGIKAMTRPPELPVHKIVGLEKSIEDVKKMVFVEDDSCGPVVITAPPGSGKTTLATMLCHDREINEKFGKDIIFVTVSSKPEHESLNKLANMIKQTGNRDILLVLDDVPHKGENIIENFVVKKPGYKIVVTSRSSFPTLENRIRVYELEKLNEEDALAVFCNAAFPNGKPDPKLDAYVKKIMNCYRASPLALKVIGGSLYNRRMFSWEAMVDKWSEGASICDSREVWDVVKTCLYSLDDDGLSDVKECYLDLGSFPEDQRIPVTALRDIWVEKYGHRETGTTTLNHLYELSIRNLINFNLPSEDVDGIEGSSNDHYIRQHDLLRDLAIHCCNHGSIEERKRLIANIDENKFSHWWGKQKNLDKAELVSISTDEAFSSTWKDLHTPNAEVLVLNSRTDLTLPNFLNKMDRLRVIIITNYGFRNAQLDNTQVLTELRNLTRIRFERFFITSIPEMGNLEKLSLIMCEFGDAFADCTSDMASILPKLVEFEIDRPFGLKKLPNGLCNISGLERLGITYCQELVELPEELGKLTNLESLRLHSCIDLKELPDSLCDLRNLKHLDITDCLAIDKLPERMGELGNLESLHMRCCGGRWGLKDLPTSVENLKSLEKVICSEETAQAWRSFEGIICPKIIVPEEDFRRSFSRITGKYL